MIASLIGMGVSLLASGWKAVQESKANAKYQRERDAEFAKNKADVNASYQQKYYENPLSRADNQALINHQRQLLDDMTRKANATATITGATPEAIQAQKTAAANAMAQTISNVAANNEQTKDAVWSDWQGAKQNIRKEYLENRAADYKTKMDNITKFGELAGQLGTTAANAFASEDGIIGTGEVPSSLSSGKKYGSSITAAATNAGVKGSNSKVPSQQTASKNRFNLGK